MRIAVLNPVFLLEDQEKNFNGYNYCFFLKYVMGIYCTDIRRINQFKIALEKMGIDNIKFIFSLRELNKSADVLISFNGKPYLPQHCPPKNFKGMQIIHVMDYVFSASRSEKSLVRSNVPYIMGYCNHDLECAFFRQYYHFRGEEIISVPFGYGERFLYNTPFLKRKNKAIALGSVNKVNDIKSWFGRVRLKEYENFYAQEIYTHKLRRSIVEHRDRWNTIIDDKLPTFPETKNPHYDPVKELNQYKMFINDAGLMNFPPARTYEGIACGAVMVAENLDIYKKIGFVSDYNCILFEKGNYEEMIYKIKYYIENSNKLEQIHTNSLALSKQFTHKKIAEQLYVNLSEKYEIWKKKR